MYYGYYIPSGYKGKLKDGRWMLFATEQEYIEYMNEED